MNAQQPQDNLFDKIADMIGEREDAGLNARVTRVITERAARERAMTYTVMGGWKFMENRTGMCAAQTPDGVIVIDPQEKRILQVYETETSRYAGRVFQYADPSAKNYIDAEKTWDGKVKRLLGSFDCKLV